MNVTEPVPGVYTIQSATYFIKSLGNAAKKQGAAGWMKRDLQVDEVKIDDFQSDQSLFDWKSLPIPIGTTVTDRRYDPPLQFNHGIDPLDEEILRQASKRNK